MSVRAVSSMVSPPRHPAKIPAIISKAIREVENFVWFIGFEREKGGNKDLTGINKIWGNRKGTL